MVQVRYLQCSVGSAGNKNVGHVEDVSEEQAARQVARGIVEYLDLSTGVDEDIPLTEIGLGKRSIKELKRDHNVQTVQDFYNAINEGVDFDSVYGINDDNIGEFTAKAAEIVS